MNEIFEIDWNECPYCKCTYEEWDIGYKEYECAFYNNQCYGGSIENGCPLAFEYSVKE